MGMARLLLLLALIPTVLLSVKAKGYVRYKTRVYRTDKLEEISYQTPLAKGLSELVAASGGIYLSLILFLDFLKLSRPDQMEMLGMTVDPLAGASMLVAIGQPMVRSAVEFLKDRKGVHWF
jgi:hypothetical protein